MKFAAATCAPGIFTYMSCFPAAVLQLNSGGQLKPTRGERLAALLGKGRGAFRRTVFWVWTSWAITPILTLVAEPAWPYLVLHLLALCWPLVDIDLSLLLTGPVQALLWFLDLALCWPCFFALLIWPWAGHAAYRS